MRVRIPVSSCLVLFAACQSAPIPEPAAAGNAELAQLQGEVRMLASLCTSGYQSGAGVAVEAGDTIGLEARLAALTERLDDLLLRMPAPAPTASPVADASGRRGTTADVVCIAAIRDAIAVVDRAQQVVIENIANVNTAGYKRRDLVTTAELDQRTGLVLPHAHGVRAVFTTGTLEITERSLDVAIDGEGFFAVVLPDGSNGYTRDGGFQIDADGMVVTSTGCRVLPVITVPSDTLELSLDPAGRVCCRTAGNPDTATMLGQLALTRFVNPAGLATERGSLLRVTEAAGVPQTGYPGTQGFGVLKQGFIERSNVQILNESVNLQVLRRQRSELRRALASFGVAVS